MVNSSPSPSYTIHFTLLHLSPSSFFGPGSQLFKGEELCSFNSDFQEPRAVLETKLVPTYCGRQNNNLSKTSQESVNVTLHGKRDFTDGIKLRILRWGNYPGLSGWVQCNHKGPYKWETRYQGKRRCDYRKRC